MPSSKAWARVILLRCYILLNGLPHPALHFVSFGCGDPSGGPEQSLKPSQHNAANVLFNADIPSSGAWARVILLRCCILLNGLPHPALHFVSFGCGDPSVGSEKV